MLDEKRVSRKTCWWLVVGILVLSVLWCASGVRAGAQDDPTPTQNCWVQDGQLVCVGDNPVSITVTPTSVIATPTPEATPIIVRPQPLGPCRISPGCVLLPLVVTP